MVRVSFLTFDKEIQISPKAEHVKRQIVARGKVDKLLHTDSWIIQHQEVIHEYIYLIVIIT